MGRGDPSDAERERLQQEDCDLIAGRGNAVHWLNDTRRHRHTIHLRRPKRLLSYGSGSGNDKSVEDMPMSQVLPELIARVVVEVLAQLSRSGHSE